MKVKRCFLEWSLVSRRFAVALTFVLGGGMLLAANLVPLKGVVKDASGEPLAGVTVRIKDGKSGTITDVNGHFVLDVEKGKKLLLSYIGYSETEVLVKDDQQMQIVLKEDAQQLQEVVVVGYGTAKKVNLVGAVDQIDSKQIAERSNSNISRSLQGMVPGLNITFSDGKPSRTPSINLRGTGSIGAGGSALVLINGVEGDLNSVNPADVESVSVLKDASSAAIYGARGAFGVILVTTKNATAGKTKINYNGSFSMHQRTVKTEDGIVSNGLQWTDGWYTAYLEGQEAPPGGINNVFKYSTDWYNELVRRDADPSRIKCVSMIRGNMNTLVIPTGWISFIKIRTIPLNIMSALVGEMSVPGIMCQDATTIRMAFIMPETKSIRSIISVQKEKYKSINLFCWRIIRMS